MNSRRIITGTLVAMAAMVAGCSDKGGIVGPSVDEATTFSQSSAGDNYANAKVNPMPIRYLSLDGKLRRSNLEGGCWYFETETGDASPMSERFEPDFGGAIPAELKDGQRLHVRGYVQEDHNSICMIGPSLRITEYKMLSAPPSTSPENQQNDAALAPQNPAGEVTLRGFLGLTERGCYSLTNGKDIHALIMPLSVAPHAIGSFVEVDGYWSMTDGSPCGLGTPLVVTDITYLAPAPLPDAK